MRIVWFRRDLRLGDNEALASAIEAGPVIPVFVQDADTPPGGAARAWLGRSLASLAESLRTRGSQLVVRSGEPGDQLAALAEAYAADAVHCSRDWTPEGMAEERRVAQGLAAKGVPLLVSEGQLLTTPDGVRTADGRPYSVFTPFHRAWTGTWRPLAPLPIPTRVPGPTKMPPSEPVTVAPGSPGSHAAPDLDAWWTPGEIGARERLAAFMDDALDSYAVERDLPAVHGTSELSPHLAFGEISPRQVVFAVAHRGDEAAAFVRQLAWREFAVHILHHHPDSATRPLRPEFERFPWRDDPEALEAWVTGRTGFPLVDAGMRQLAATGWMHNRVRLVCGSFLTKDLLVPWQTGAAVFRDRLVDHDAASNAFNWQWVAGSGADAAPYFRVFNPSLQQARFDSAGEYVRRWVPELGTDEYPRPIVDHAAARVRALAALSATKRG